MNEHDDKLRAPETRSRSAMLSSEQVLKILREADELNNLEFPACLDQHDLEQRARLVLKEISDEGLEAGFEDWNCNQDASFGLAITLDSFSLRKGDLNYLPTIRFSNFGNLASITWAEQLNETSMEAVLGALSRNGFVFIPENQLNIPYDGINAPNPGIPTWWVRYFDWL